MLWTDHFQGSDGSLFSLMPVFATGSFGCLLIIVNGKHTKDGGHRQQQVQLKYPIGNRAAHIFKMRGITAQHAAQRNECMGFVVAVFVLIPVAFDPKRDFKGTGNDHGMVPDVVLIEHFSASFFQQAGYRIVPFGTYNYYTGTLRKKDACGM